MTATKTPRRRLAPVATHEPTCSLCSSDRPGARVDARGDLGVVHHACFVQWDLDQEAREAMAPLDFDLDPANAPADGSAVA